MTGREEQTLVELYHTNGGEYGWWYITSHELVTESGKPLSSELIKRRKQLVGVLVSLQKKGLVESKELNRSGYSKRWVITPLGKSVAQSIVASTTQIMGASS